MENNVNTVLYVLVIISKLMKKNISSIDKFEIHQLVYKLNKLHVTTREGQSLLHLCVNFRTPVDDFHTNNVCKFPCAEVARLLIRCGANVNAMDNERNTPLHIIVSYQKPVRYNFCSNHTLFCVLKDFYFLLLIRSFRYSKLNIFKVSLVFCLFFLRDSDHY